MDAITILLGVICLQAIAIGALLAAIRRMRADLAFERVCADTAETKQQALLRARLTRARSRDAGRRELAKVYSILDRSR